VCGLVQVFLDPFARTMRGFCSLVAKEWCSFGHKFSERAGHMLDKDDGDISPVFVQFLDAVAQLVRLFPRAFEFNARLPLLLAHHLYSCRFGTFLFNNERERAEAAAESRTGSLWAYVLGGGPVTDALRAREYDPRAGDVLLPHPAALMRNLVLWNDWFARYAPFPSLPASSAAMETYDAAFYSRAALDAARLPPLPAAAPAAAAAAAAAPPPPPPAAPAAPAGAGAAEPAPAGAAAPAPAADDAPPAAAAPVPPAPASGDATPTASADAEQSGADDAAGHDALDADYAIGGDVGLPPSVEDE